MKKNDLAEISITYDQRPIIMIDDDREDLEMARELVNGLDIANEMITFSNPLAALDFLQNRINPFPIFIICDVNMPKMDGFEFRAQLLKDPELQKLPFFFLSTSKSPGEMVLANECQVTGYYQKAGSYKEQENIFSTMFRQAKASHSA